MTPFRSPACGALLLTLLSPAHAVEIMRWERLPLAVPLIVGQERVVFIDRNVRVGIPAEVANRIQVQSVGGAVYLRANAPIEPTRLQLRDTESGAVVLVDIAAESAREGEAPLEPVRIVAPGTAVEQQDDPAQTRTVPPPARATPIPVVLTRYAAQSLYAPLRTIDPVPGIARVNLRRDTALDTLLPTLPITALALAAWRLDDFLVSAVRLRNTSSRWLELDPRALQGGFAAATFQHRNLGPAGTPEDTSVVYLVTRQHGLTQALLPAVSPVNASLNLQPAADKPNLDGGHDAQ